MSIDSVRDSARAQLSGAARELIDQELLYTIRDLFRYTRVWVFPDSITTTQGQLIYSLSPPQGAEIWRIHSVSEFQGVSGTGPDLHPVNQRDRPNYISEWYYEFDRGQGSIILTSALENPSGRTLLVNMILVPETIYDVPDGWAEELEEPLLNGTLYRMMIHPNRPYTNQGTALSHGRRYQAARTRIRNERYRSFAEAGIGWSFPLATRSRTLR